MVPHVEYPLDDCIFPWKKGEKTLKLRKHKVRHTCGGGYQGEQGVRHPVKIPAVVEHGYVFLDEVPVFLEKLYNIFRVVMFLRFIP